MGRYDILLKRKLEKNPKTEEDDFITDLFRKNPDEEKIDPDEEKIDPDARRYLGEFWGRRPEEELPRPGPDIVPSISGIIRPERNGLESVPNTNLLSTPALRVDGDTLITGNLTVRGAPEMIINPAYSRNFFIRTGQRIKYFISRLFKQPRLRIVWSEQLSVEDLEDLREQVHLALEDPEHVIVSNYEIHAESLKF
jgi:hypothetical protein